MSFKDDFYNELSKLSNLYEVVNEIVVLHEYIVGTFPFPALVKLNDFSDYLFQIYKEEKEKSIKNDFSELKSILNYIGLLTLHSLIKRECKNVNAVLNHRKNSEDVLNSISLYYGELTAVISEINSFNDDNDPLESDFSAYDFVPLYHRYICFFKFSDDIKRSSHLLKAYRKRGNKEYILSLLSSNIVSVLVFLFFMVISIFSSWGSLFSGTATDISKEASVDTVCVDSVDALIIK